VRVSSEKPDFVDNRQERQQRADGEDMAAKAEATPRIGETKSGGSTSCAPTKRDPKEKEVIWTSAGANDTTEPH
jgi:hypothetical protein